MKIELKFMRFNEAAEFGRKIRTGKIQRIYMSDEFLWTSEDDLDEAQLDIFAEEHGTKYVWKDPETDLTWLFQNKYFESPNVRSQGGHNDWRLPTLFELKTLRAEKKNEYGAYVKEGVPHKLTSDYKAAECFLGEEHYWWNYSTNKHDREHYHEGGIIWGHEGSFGGFEESTSNGSAKIIWVRGENKKVEPDWVISILEWAEKRSIIYDLPVSQKGFESLESLSLSSVKSLPPELVSLPNIREFQLRADPHLIAELRFENLEKLLVAEYFAEKVVSFPENIFSFKQLREFRAQKFRYSSLPEEVGELQHLESLEILLDDKATIPDSIGSLQNLFELKIKGGFSTIPSSVYELTNLKILHLETDGFIGDLSSSISQLENLEELKISGVITSIPKEVWHLPSLKVLHVCAKGRLQRLPGLKVKNETLEDVCFDASDFESFPEELYMLPSLKKLVVSGDNINYMPWEIELFTRLKLLDFEKTNISSLPESILNLEELEDLYLPPNKFKFPVWLSQMTSLRKIFAHGASYPYQLDNMRGYWM